MEDGESAILAGLSQKLTGFQSKIDTIADSVERIEIWQLEHGRSHEAAQKEGFNRREIIAVRLAHIDEKLGSAESPVVAERRITELEGRVRQVTVWLELIGAGAVAALMNLPSWLMQTIMQLGPHSKAPGGP